MSTSHQESNDTGLGTDSKWEEKWVERQVGEKASLADDAEESGPERKKQKIADTTTTTTAGDDTKDPTMNKKEVQDQDENIKVEGEEKDEKKNDETEQSGQESDSKADAAADHEVKDGTAAVSASLLDTSVEKEDDDNNDPTSTAATTTTATETSASSPTTNTPEEATTSTTSSPPKAKTSRTKKVAKPNKKTKTKKKQTTSPSKNNKSSPNNIRGANAPWELRYQQLLEYKEIFGHTNVPQNYSPNPALGHWVRNQRSRYKYHMGIGKKRNRKKKQQVDVDGEEKEEGRDGSEEEPDGTEAGKDGGTEKNVSAEETKKPSDVDKDTTTNDTNEVSKAKPPQSESEDPPQEEGQDPEDPKGQYSQQTTKHIQMLEDIGFEWIARNRARYVTWQDRFDELKAYYEEHGTTDLPQPPHDTHCLQLKLWCQTQRTSYMHFQQNKDSQMNRERIDKLESINFNWHGQRKTTPFQVRLRELKEFKAKYGDVSVPKKFRANPGLGIWCHEKRRLYKSRQEGHKTSLTDKQIEQLDKLGFVWSFKGQPYNAWDRYFRDLIQYKAENGNCSVPKDFYRNKRLANWVDKQRKNYLLKKEGKASPLTDEQEKKLEKLNFLKVSWCVFVEDLKEYKAKNGNCNVPQAYKTERTNLGQWVMRQRCQYRLFNAGDKSQLDLEKIKELEEIGFEFPQGVSARQRSLRNKKWEEHLEELKQYKEKFGNADVKFSNGESREYARLAGWTNHQRTEYLRFTQGRSSYLTEERIAAMNELGFNWTLKYRKIPWDERIIELKKYKEKHGHLHVPKRMGNLGTWCHERRKQYKQFEAGKKCSMSKQQIKELKDLGFVFHPTRQKLGRAGRKKSTQENDSAKKKSEKKQTNTTKKASWPDQLYSGGPGTIPPSQLSVPPLSQLQAQSDETKQQQPSGVQLQQPSVDQIQPIPTTQQQQQTQSSSVPQFYPPLFQQQMNTPIPHQNAAYPSQQNFQAQQQQQGNMSFQMMPGAPFRPFKTNAQTQTDPNKMKG